MSKIGDDIIQSLQEAIAYKNGELTKGVNVVKMANENKIIEMTEHEKLVTLQLAIRCSLGGLVSIDDKIVPILERNWDLFDEEFKSFIKREVKNIYDTINGEREKSAPYPLYTETEQQIVVNKWSKFLTM